MSRILIKEEVLRYWTFLGTESSGGGKVARPRAD